jgi:hypothetical protein
MSTSTQAKIDAILINCLNDTDMNIVPVSSLPGGLEYIPKLEKAVKMQNDKTTNTSQSSVMYVNSVFDVVPFDASVNKNNSQYGSYADLSKYNILYYFSIHTFDSHDSDDDEDSE